MYLQSVLCLLLLFAGTVSVALCQVNPMPAATRTAAEGSAASNMLAKTGGLVVPPVSGPQILLLNAQKRVPFSTIQDVSDKIRSLVHLPCMAEDGHPGSDPIEMANRALARSNCAAVIVICQRRETPSLLVAPENRWAIVNISPLLTSAPVSNLTVRTSKELWRAFGFVMGAANSNFEHCLLKPVFSPADLDSLACSTISPEPFPRLWKQAKRMGLIILKPTTYQKAVEDGWAPAPTNEVQKAIWNDAHMK